MNQPSDETRWIWVGEYLRGEASAETTAELEKQLRADEEFRAQFIEHANVDLGIALLVESSGLEEDKKIARFPRSFPMRKLAYAITAAAACLFLGLWIALNNAKQPFAEVVNQIGVNASNQIASSLSDEEVRLTSGLLELKTARGAHLVIEAPATFQFESAQLLRLRHGRIAATVPPSATGFSVQTPTGKAIDIGTEFGVDVPAEGEPEIHVFDGEVIAQSEDGARKNLFGGEAFSLAGATGLTRDLRSAAFIRAEEFALFEGQNLSRQRERSESAWQKLEADPALIAALNFEDSQDLPEGSFRMTQGRFPGTRAPEFVREGEHMKLDIGGTERWPELTLAAWVRLDRLGAPYQSLLHTDGWGQQARNGQVHWMVTKETTMRLALFGNQYEDGRHAYPDSSLPVLPERGRWVHLATVYDSEARTTRFYLNGAFDREVEIGVAHPALLGPAQLGNWDQTDRKLSGRIDELILLGRSLSSEEIEALFDAGNPYRK